jgi:hypothetical protein
VGSEGEPKVSRTRAEREPAGGCWAYDSLCHAHAPLNPPMHAIQCTNPSPSPAIIPKTTPQEPPSSSPASPPSPSRTTVLSSAMRTQVRFSFFLPVAFPFTFPLSSLHPFLHYYQVPRRWHLWHSMALRLAWGPTPQYPPLSDAMRSGCASRVGRKATCGGQAHEEAVARRLGRMSETQGAPSACTTFIHSHATI